MLARFREALGKFLGKIILLPALLSVLHMLHVATAHLDAAKELARSSSEESKVRQQTKSGLTLITICARY